MYWDEYRQPVFPSNRDRDNRANPLRTCGTSSGNKLLIIRNLPSLAAIFSTSSKLLPKTGCGKEAPWEKAAKPPINTIAMDIARAKKIIGIPLCYLFSGDNPHAATIFCVIMGSSSRHPPKTGLAASPQCSDIQPGCFFPQCNQDPEALAGMPRPKPQVFWNRHFQSQILSVGPLSAAAPVRQPDTLRMR